MRALTFILGSACGWGLFGAFQATDAWAFGVGACVVFVLLVLEAIS